jgi:hypothetical protein
MDLRENGWRVWTGFDWIRLARDRDRWRAVVNAVMNLWVLASRSYFSSVVYWATAGAYIKVIDGLEPTE